MQVQTPFEHCWPASHAGWPAPHSHPPAEQRSAVKEEQATHAAPPVPQFPKAERMHWFWEQHPGPDAPQTHTPPSQSWPALHASPAPHWHTPAAQWSTPRS